MRISLEWLTQFVEWSQTDPLRIADALTLASAEVEEVEMQGKYLRDCLVGRVMNLRKHPKADRLSLRT